MNRFLKLKIVETKVFATYQYINILHTRHRIEYFPEFKFYNVPHITKDIILFEGPCGGRKALNINQLDTLIKDLTDIRDAVNEVSKSNE